MTAVTRRRPPRWSVALCIGVALGTAGACTPGDVTVDLPAAWLAERSGATIELSDGGTGRVRDLPVWHGTGRGSAAGADHYTGDVTWTSLGEGALEIVAPAGSVRVFADGQFLSVDWFTIDVAVCGDDSRIEDLVVYTQEV